MVLVHWWFLSDVERAPDKVERTAKNPTRWSSSSGVQLGGISPGLQAAGSWVTVSQVALGGVVHLPLDESTNPVVTVVGAVCVFAQRLPQ